MWLVKRKLELKIIKKENKQISDNSDSDLSKNSFEEEDEDDEEEDESLLTTEELEGPSDSQ